MTAFAVLTFNSCRYISLEPSYEGDGTCIECEMDTSIPAGYDGTMATDTDTPGTDINIYWEKNNFSNKVEVIYDGATARVSTSYKYVTYTIQGANVTLDFKTKGGSSAEVIVKGSSAKGSLKILSGAKLKLTLSGVELSSEQGPAINFQDKKSLFLHMTDGTTNKLSDGFEYPDSEQTEDQKGCIFSEGPVVFSGKGLLSVTGNYRHGIATDSYMWMRPATTIVVNNACASGIKVKGANKVDADGDMLGLVIKGGYLFSRVDKEGAKAINCETNIKIYSGKVEAYATGKCKYVPEILDIQKATAVKADQNLCVYDGTLVAKVSGEGARAIRTHGSLNMYGGTINATASGKYFKYHNLFSKPRAVKSDMSINIKKGDFNVASVGRSDYAVAVNAGKKFTNNLGNVYAYAYEDAFKVQDFEVNGGYNFGFSENGDAIDSDNEVCFNGGVNEFGAKSSAFENGGGLYINGGTVLGVCGVGVTPTSYMQSYAYYNLGISGNTGDVVAVLEGNETIFSFKIPRSRHESVMLYSSEDETFDSSYDIYKWGELSGLYTERRILVEDADFTGGYFVDTLRKVVYK